MNAVELILSIITAVLGSGLVATVVFYRPKRRKADAEAESVEITNEQTEVDRLEARLKTRDDKIDIMYVDYRKLQLDYIDLLKKHNAIELSYREAELKRCDVRGCTHRIPPSDY